MKFLEREYNGRTTDISERGHKTLPGEEKDKKMHATSMSHGKLFHFQENTMER